LGATLLGWPPCSRCAAAYRESHSQPAQTHQPHTTHGTEQRTLGYVKDAGPNRAAAKRSASAAAARAARPRIRNALMRQSAEQ